MLLHLGIVLDIARSFNPVIDSIDTHILKVLGDIKKGDVNKQVYFAHIDIALHLRHRIYFIVI